MIRFRSSSGPAGDDRETDALAWSQRSLRDLAALLALPAMWIDHDPAYITADLSAVLFSLLNLDNVYVSFADPNGGPLLECWRPASAAPSNVFQSLLVTRRVSSAAPAAAVALQPDATHRIASMKPAFPGEDGLILVSATREDFPTNLELHLFRIAVGQATIALHTARLLAAERAARLAAEATLHTVAMRFARLSTDLALAQATLAHMASEIPGIANPGDEPENHSSIATSPVPDTTSSPIPDAAPISVPAHLSRRELEVLALLAQGLSNKQIAAELWLSDRTVERHITGVYTKIGVQRRTEATLFAIKHGIVDSDSSGT